MFVTPPQSPQHMPLPPPPAKRAALISIDGLDAPERQPAKNLKTDSKAALMLKNPHPAAFLSTEKAVSSMKSGASSYKKESIQLPVRARDQRVEPHIDSRVDMATPPKPAKKPKHTGPTKLFVLDTNVLMHDPMCLFRFEEHDIFLPMIVLEELDGHKKGMTEVARNARQTSRSLDALAGAKDADIAKGLKLDTTGHREAKGSLLFQTKPLDYTLPTSLPQGKADNQILGVVEALRKEYAPTRGGAGVQRHQHACQGARAGLGN